MPKIAPIPQTPNKCCKKVPKINERNSDAFKGKIMKKRGKGLKFFVWIKRFDKLKKIFFLFSSLNVTNFALF